MSVRAPKRRRVDLSSKTVVVSVGSEKKEYNVHEGLLTNHSLFFKAALGNEWKERGTRRISLPEDELDPFEVYAQWLYYPKICSREEENVLDAWVREINRLALAYILGEKLQDTSFKNAVIDAWLCRTGTETDDGLKWLPDAKVVTTLYENTTESSPVRRLMVDYYLLSHTNDFDREQGDFPAEFYRELAMAFVDQRYEIPEAPEARDPCHYHEHKTEGNPRCGRT